MWELKLQLVNGGHEFCVERRRHEFVVGVDQFVELKWRLTNFDDGVGVGWLWNAAVGSTE